MSNIFCKRFNIEGRDIDMLKKLKKKRKKQLLALAYASGIALSGISIDSAIAADSPSQRVTESSKQNNHKNVQQEVTPKLVGETSIDAVVAAMTLKEKASLVVGGNKEELTSGNGEIIGTQATKVPGAAGQTQLHKMMERGVEARRIFVDKASGRHFDRPQYQLLRKILSTGDIVYMDALDRMGRNYDEVISEWKYITRELQADIIVLENESLFDSRKFRDMGDMGRLMEDQFLSLLSYVADQERKKIHQRQAEGIAVAKSQGKHLGRPQVTLSTLSKQQINLIEETHSKWKSGEITAVMFMEMLELKKNTFYKIMKEYEEEK